MRRSTFAVSTVFTGLAAGVAGLAGTAEYPVPLPRFLVGVALLFGGAALGAMASGRSLTNRRCGWSGLATRS